MKNCIIEKAKKTIARKVKVIFFWNRTKKLKKTCSQHNSMTRLCRALFKYENKREWVEIIELKLFSALK